MFILQSAISCNSRVARTVTDDRRWIDLAKAAETYVGVKKLFIEEQYFQRYRGGSPTAVQAWRTCPLWELSPIHRILV